MYSDNKFFQKIKRFNTIIMPRKLCYIEFSCFMVITLTLTKVDSKSAACVYSYQTIRYSYVHIQ